MIFLWYKKSNWKSSDRLGQNNETSYNYHCDVLHLLWNALQFFGEKEVRYVFCKNSLQGRPIALGLHIYLTNVESESFLMEVCFLTYPERASLPEQSMTENNLTSTIYWKSHYQIHPTIGSLISLVFERQIISRKPVSAISAHLDLTKWSLLITVKSGSILLASDEIFKVTVVVRDIYNQLQSLHLSEPCIENVVPERFASVSNEIHSYTLWQSCWETRNIIKVTDTMSKSPHMHQVQLLRHMLINWTETQTGWERHSGRNATACNAVYVRVLVTKTIQGMKSGARVFWPSRSQQARNDPRVSGESFLMVQLHVYVALLRAINQLLIMIYIEYLTRKATFGLG